ncbi:hypothetical protein ACFQY7_49800 [Actinomadura luteofluorescens]
MGRQILYGVIAAVVVLTVFGLGGSPYNRVGPGPRSGSEAPRAGPGRS